MKKKIFIVIFIAVIASCSTSSGGGGKVVKVEGGASFPKEGLVIDASYDKKFDGYFPGYKVVNVAIFNSSFDIIPLNPEFDRWYVKIDRKNIAALHDLRKANPQMWSNLNEKQKNLVSYPLALAIGASQVVDLFVPEDIPIEKFTDVVVYFDFFKRTYQISARQ